MNEDILLVERDGPVVTLTLNRPHVLNALNVDSIARLTTELDALDADRTVRAAILTGAGERAFAAGADISELAALGGPADGERKARIGQALTQRLETLRVPIIAAVNGFALGGGCELAIACDIRIASENAKFGQPEVNLGIMPGYGGSQRLPRLVGEGMAMYLCLTTEPIDAAEALRIGLVQRVYPREALLSEARKLAATIASKAPLAIAATKRAILDGAALGLIDALSLEALAFGELIGTEDYREGTRAFLDKRPATFRGA